MNITCPKCGHQRHNGDDPTIPATNCPKCGIAYVKADPRLSHLTPPRPVKARNNSGYLSINGRELINIGFVQGVANAFLIVALIGLILLAIELGLAISSKQLLDSMFLLMGLLSEALTLAGFGYIVKLLLGIYINTSR